MIEIRKSDDRGHANHGWLDARHTFSFAEYHDPEFMGFGPLRVLNQDRIRAGKGFPPHPHRDMEIVTYVLSGILEHEDSMGNGSQIRPGEVQLMSAGRGVMHSEFNGSDHEDLHLLQMWIVASKKRTEPRYEQRAFTAAERTGSLRLVVSPDERDGSLRIGQDALLFSGLFAPGHTATHDLDRGRSAWLHVARGRISLNGLVLATGDGAGIRDEKRLELDGVEDADVVLWEFGAS